MSGYLLNTEKTKCYGYDNEELETKPVQNLVDGVIDGSISIDVMSTLYCDLYFDIDEGPIINNFEVKGYNKDNEEISNGYTYDKVKYDISWNDEDVEQYCIGKSIECNDWEVITEEEKESKLISKEESSYTSTEGSHTLYVYLKDKANNVSEVKENTIVVDRTVPKIDTFTLTGSLDSGTELSDKNKYTHTTNITYNAKITEANIEGYCVQEGNSCDSYESGIGTTLNISNTEGSHTISINVKDKVGNIGSSTSTIILDSIKPVASITSSAPAKNSITVTVSGTDTNGIIERYCKESSKSEWITASSNGSCVVSGLSAGTEYTIEVKVKDGSGRVSDIVSQKFSTEGSKPPTTGENFAKGVLGVIPKGISASLLGGMYRFYGTPSDVDNYICFGYNDPTTECKSPTSNFMYRIIGITSDKKMKLIKNTSVGRLQWHYTNQTDTVWVDSDIFKRINGTHTSLSNVFVNDSQSRFNIKSTGDTTWYDKIENHTWLYGGMSDADLNRGSSYIYSIETGTGIDEDTQAKWIQKVTAKVALMYVSDYSYAAGGSDNLDCGTGGLCKISWMYIINNGLSDEYNFEWTMVRRSAIYEHSDEKWYGSRDASYTVDLHGFLSTLSVRPVFYLLSTAKVSGGTGTSTDPFIVAK